MDFYLTKNFQQPKKICFCKNDTLKALMAETLAKFAFVDLFDGI
jgi:hypothetical protein